MYMTIIFTVLLILFGGLVVRYIFLLQGRRYRHEQEKLVMKEQFNKTLTESEREIQEQTLKYISEQIHDRFNPELISIKRTLRFFVPGCPPAAQEKIDGVVTQVQDLYEQMRALQLSLHTEQLMHMGFRQSLQNELNRLAKTGHYHTNLSVVGNELYLEPEHRIILFRICQEVLNNILKHAEAGKIEIVMDYSVTPITLTISEDGKGFIPAEVLAVEKRKEKLGIYNIFTRAAQINAKVDIESAPGNGSRTIIRINNLKEEQHDKFAD
jgi:signal transduction histidine kinase